MSVFSCVSSFFKKSFYLFNCYNYLSWYSFVGIGIPPIHLSFLLPQAPHPHQLSPYYYNGIVFRQQSQAQHSADLVSCVFFSLFPSVSQHSSHFFMSFLSFAPQLLFFFFYRSNHFISLSPMLFAYYTILKIISCFSCMSLIAHSLKFVG